MITKEQINQLLKEGQDMYPDLQSTLIKIDKRLNAYVYSNLFDPNAHGTYEKLSVVRFLSFFYKYDFNVKAVKQYIRFSEALPIKSEKGMRTFPLQGFQVFVAANIFGWTKPNGNRLIRDALLYVPRKASKSSFMAQLSIYSLIFDAPDGQIYCASNSFNQSQVLFKIIEASIKSLDPKMKSFHRNRQQIYSVLPGKDSFISCLSSSPDRLDGLNPSLIILDEYAAAKDSELRNVLTSGMGARSNPLTCTITTASTLLEGPFVEMLSNYKKILSRELSNDSIFALIFEAEEGDDISNPVVWKRVQPMYGVSVQEEFYEEEYKKAQLTAEDSVNFKTKLLNIFCPAVNASWIKPALISRNLKDFKLEQLTGNPLCMVSFDLSVKDDMSSVAYTVYDSLTHVFATHIDYYLPSQTIENHSNRELYQRWVDQGYLKICGEETIDYTQIAEDIINNSKYVRILQINYDSWKNKELTNHLRASGVKNLTSYKQTYAYFTSPIESIEFGLSENKMLLDNNPITQWEFGNCAIDEDNIGNKKMIKISPSRKIDGIVCLAMNIGAFSNWKR